MKYPALVLATSFICMLILQATLSITVVNLAISPAHAAPDTTTVYLDPAEITIVPGVNDSIGTIFNVSIWVKDVTDLCSYQILIRYNQSIVDCINATEPVDDPNYVLASLVPHTVTTTKDRFGNYTMAGGQYPGYELPHFNGTGLITIFKFNITKAGMLSCSLSIDNDQTFLLESTATQIEPLIRENGHYQLIPEFLPLLTMLTFMSITTITLAFRKKLRKKISNNVI